MNPCEIAVISDQSVSKLCFSKVTLESFTSKGLQDGTQRANKMSGFPAVFAKSKIEFQRLYFKPEKLAGDSMLQFSS